MILQFVIPVTDSLTSDAQQQMAFQFVLWFARTCVIVVSVIAIRDADPIAVL
jgi:hypothetical protein